MLLTGTYQRALDEKQRLALPKRFREVMSGTGQPLFLTPGTDGSLSLFTGPSFARMAEKLAAQSPTAHDVRAFGRLLYGQSQSIELDGQGRFRVPTDLARHAELARDCVLIGVGDHVELWDKGRWEAYLAEQQPRYDQLAESALAGGVAAAPSVPQHIERSSIEESVVRPTQPR